jgi:hypothetical protein
MYASTMIASKKFKTRRKSTIKYSTTKACVGETMTSFDSSPSLHCRYNDSAFVYTLRTRVHVHVADLQLTRKLRIGGPLVNEFTKQHLKLSLKGLLETSKFLQPFEDVSCIQ